MMEKGRIPSSTERSTIVVTWVKSSNPITVYLLETNRLPVKQGQKPDWLQFTEA